MKILQELKLYWDEKNKKQSDIFDYWNEQAKHGDKQALKMLKDMNKSVNRDKKDANKFRKQLANKRALHVFIIRHIGKPYYFMLAFIFLSCVISLGIEQWRFYAS